MSWQVAQTLAWEDPLRFASRFQGQDMALLYSGLQERFTGGVSYLFVKPLEVCSGNDWAELPVIATSDSPLPLWVGYVGYEMGMQAPRGGASPVELPDFRLICYAQLFAFDHQAQRISAYTQDGSTIELPQLPPATETKAVVASITSNFTRAEYEQVVARTVEQIRDGNFYQANITRKFFGEFSEVPDSWQLFIALTEASPAPYSAYIFHGDSTILSSSPECFLRVDADGSIISRPIKGSARRNEDSIQDELIQKELATSDKNHAENLMIVDLMRNDLSRVSETSSVEVIEQSQLYSYQTIHHLISTILAKRLSNISTYDIVQACMPPGSMTGAPKIAAVRWCAAQEKLQRGVYSGALGWFGSQTCDLSVVIRTLILSGKKFEFQVGGGIVVDSKPEDEWLETIAKSRGILRMLGLKETDLALI